MADDGTIRTLSPPTKAQNFFALGLTICFFFTVVVGGWYLRTHRGEHTTTKMQGTAGRASLAPVKINDLTVAFQGEFRMPTSELQMEFKNAQGQLIDVGTVKLALDMNMPSMVMHSSAIVTGSGGRYTAKLKPQMAGDWTAKLSYNGPQGAGEKTFRVVVK